MSDFEEILVTEGHGNTRWKTSKNGNWLYISECWEGRDGIARISKSNAGNPYRIRVHIESLGKFLDHVNHVYSTVKQDNSQDVPF
ncbi:MAG: hypothetical protein ACWGQW_23330 [bacterium]